MTPSSISFPLPLALIHDKALLDATIRVELLRLLHYGNRSTPGAANHLIPWINPSSGRDVSLIHYSTVLFVRIKLKEDGGVDVDATTVFASALYVHIEDPATCRVHPQASALMASMLADPSKDRTVANGLREMHGQRCWSTSPPPIHCPGCPMPSEMLENVRIPHVILFFFFNDLN